MLAWCQWPVRRYADTPTRRYVSPGRRPANTFPPHADTPARRPADTFPQAPTRRHADTPTRFLWCLLFVTILGLVQPSRTLAGTNNYWNIPNAVNGAWNTAGNWSLGVVPNTTVYSAVIEDNATVLLSGASLTTVYSVDVGDDQSSTYTSGGLTLSAGAQLAAVSDSYVGVSQNGTGADDSFGTFNIGGSGTSFTDAANFYVGLGGVGIVNITNSATVSLQNLNVGYISGTYAGIGTVTVDGGSTTTPTMTTSGSTAIGNGAGTVGTVNIQNGGIWNASGQVTVGNGGTATLNILNGGVVNVTSNPTFANGTVLISGTSSKLSLNGAGANVYLLIGSQTSAGSVTVQNGGAIAYGAAVTGTLCVGTYTGFNGALTITGTGASVTTAGADVSIGTNGYNTTGTGTNVGTLSLVAGGTMTVGSGGSMYLGGDGPGVGSPFYAYGGTGIINIGSTAGTSGAAGTSGTLVFSGNMYLDGNSQINFNNIDTSPGFAVFEGAAGTVTLAANMTITGLQFVTDGYLITTTNGSVLTASTGTILEADSGVSGTVGVQITGDGDVTKTGSGTVILAATNTYTGGTSVTAGSLVVAADQALGTGAVSIDGSTSLLQVNAGVGITNP